MNTTTSSDGSQSKNGIRNSKIGYTQYEIVLKVWALKDNQDKQASGLSSRYLMFLGTRMDNEGVAKDVIHSARSYILS